MNPVADELRWRPQNEADAPFLARLFDAGPQAGALPADLPPAMRQHLLAMQLRGQAASYRAAFPHAAFWIVEQAETPVARLVEAVAADTIHIVDIAVAPEARGRGVARALLRTVMARAPKAVTASIVCENAASRALFAGLGFHEAPADAGRVAVRWTP